MKLHQHKKSPFPLVFSASVVLHALVYIVWSLSWGGKGQQSGESSYIVQLSYVQPKHASSADSEVPAPEVKEKEDPEVLEVLEEELIDHQVDSYKFGDELSSNNQDLTKEQVLDFGAKQEVVREQEASKASEGRSFIETIDNSENVGVVGKSDIDIQSEVDGEYKLTGAGLDEINTLDSVGDADKGAESEINFIPPEDLKIPPEFLGNLGNMELLQENDLGNAFVEDPFSDKESKELKLVNKYLKRTHEQILSYWVNPYFGTKPYSGVIRFELDRYGYLVHSYIYRSSGHRLLDISYLDAVRAVPRFALPKNVKINERYYSSLWLNYDARSGNTDLMPFEKKTRKQTN